MFIYTCTLILINIIFNTCINEEGQLTWLFTCNQRLYCQRQLLEIVFDSSVQLILLLLYRVAPEVHSAVANMWCEEEEEDEVEEEILDGEEEEMLAMHTSEAREIALFVHFVLPQELYK